MPNIYVYLGLYVALLLIISWWVSRKQSSEDFFISGRNRGGWQIFASKFAAGIGAGWFITYTGFAYEYGLGVFALLLGIVVGYLVFAYWAAPKIYEHSGKNKFYTIGDFVYHKTKSVWAKHTSNILSSVILFSWLIVGFIGGAKIISDFGFLSYEVALFITAAVVLSYILLAGFKAVILTDIVQSIVIFLLLFVVTFGIIGSESVPNLLSLKTGRLDVGIAISFFLYGVLAIFSFSDRYQLCYAAKNEKKLKHGLAFAIIPIMLAAFLLLLIGLFMFSQTSGLDTGLIFTEALKVFLSPKLLPLAVVLFFAGIMSSADTSIYAISSHYALSLKEKSIKKIRGAAIVLVVFSVIIGLLYSDIVDISIFSGAISLILSFPIIYILFNGKNARRFMVSCVGGFVGLVLGIIFFGFEPYIGIPVVVLGAIGLLWWK